MKWQDTKAYELGYQLIKKHESVPIEAWSEDSRHRNIKYGLQINEVMTIIKDMNIDIRDKLYIAFTVGELYHLYTHNEDD